MPEISSIHPEVLKNRNMDFFRVNFPQVFDVLSSTELTTYGLTIDPKNRIIDLHKNGESLYSGDAITHSRHEADTFLNSFSQGKLIRTIAPPGRGKNSFVRFYSKRMNALINSVPDNIALNEWNIIPDFYPMVVFMGSGLGLHIADILSERDVLNTVVFEPDREVFLASLYVTDWDQLLQPLIDKGRKVEMMIGTLDDISVETMSGHLWNELIKYTPSFPLTCLFLNHRKRDRFEKCVNKIRNDLHFFLNQWGYYDDEINQMNNALHNLFGHVKPMVSSLKFDVPMAVIGGGPSLDQRIDELLKYHKKVLIISAGTAIHSLLKKGIIPDIHVEIESHMLTYESLSKIEDLRFFEKTLLIGAVQLPPNVFNLFKRKAYFIKDSTALSELFATKEEIVYRATPTCTNTGCAIAVHLHSPELFMYGMDFGFSSKENHHAKDSIYYTDELSDAIRAELSRTYDNITTVESVDGNDIYTIPMYNTSRRSVEYLIERMRYIYAGRAFNCSGGAKIEGSEYLTVGDIERKLQDYPDLNKEFISDAFIGVSLEADTIRDQVNYGYQYLKTSTREIQAFVNGFNPESLISLFNICHQINRHSLMVHNERYGNLIYMTRGSIWHILNAGASVALSIRDETERTAYLKRWKDTFTAYLKDLPEHYNGVTSKSYPDPLDPWIREDIVSNEHLYYE